VENKTEIMQHISKMKKPFLMSKYIKLISRDVSFLDFAFVGVHHFYGCKTLCAVKKVSCLKEYARRC
jgi:hypothetical protein